MINAFAINDSRLLRIDDEPADLSSAIWLDLLEPTGEEREMWQEGLSKRPHVSSKTKMACTCTHSSIVKTKKTTLTSQA